MNKEPTFTLAECQAEYLTGLSRGKNMMARGLMPETVEIMITVKGKENFVSDAEIETIKKVVTFQEVKQSGGKVLRYATEKGLGEILTQGILKELIES